jgi:D-tyrosyl-tRNA(Tyr) deacylase
MILLIQRVLSASVHVYGENVGSIGKGLLAFVAIEPEDDEATASRLVDRLVAYRVFNDADGKMNRSLADVGGELLLVSQFTLAADTRKGLRPSFTPAAPPELGRTVFGQVVSLAQQALPGRVATGRFGAEMQVALVNDGPVTFWLRFSSAGANESS